MSYFSGVVALVSGFFAGLSLIIAIGAQNAFVIKQGLRQSHVALVVAICSLSDATLILLGVGGLGGIVQSHPKTLEYIRWFGVLYLTWFGLKSVKGIFDNQSLELDGPNEKSAMRVLVAVLTFTFLNPHVYLDTVILLGSIANQFSDHRWFFAIGASCASFLWFSVIGFGARAASKYMSRPIFWKILDFVIALVMFSIAISLAVYKFN